MVLTKENVVELVNVRVVRNRLTILDGINLCIENGETIAVTGANGAGKSTLLRLLAGALRPTQGRILYFDNSRSGSAARRRGIGYVGHETGLYDELTVLENLRFAARMHCLDSPRERAQELIRQAGLQSLADCLVAKLSEGIRRRVAVLRSCVHRPRLVLLDEPDSSLDAEGRRWLEDCFSAWRVLKRSVCFASHDAELCHRLANRIVWLHSGRVTATDRSVDFQTIRNSA
jgi:heme ABC exporter ATP-binding subunit CcmA